MNDSNNTDLNAAIQGNYSIDIGDFISRGWEIFKLNMGGFIGFFVITILISLALAFLPFVGNLVAIVVGGPLYAGNFIVAFKIGKRQPVEFGDFFKGFQNAYFLPIFLAWLVIGLLAGLCFIPAGIGIGILVVASGGSEPNFALLSVVGVLGLIGLIGAIYLSVSYVFSIPLIVGKKMQFWPAMEASRKLVSKQWFAVFGFLFVVGLIYMAGALLCGIGVFFTGPLCICAIAAAYETIVGLPTFDPSQA